MSIGRNVERRTLMRVFAIAQLTAGAIGQSHIVAELAIGRLRVQVGAYGCVIGRCAFIGFACESATQFQRGAALIYGADDPHNGYGPNRFRRLAADGQEIVLFGEGEERRDHVWVGDVAELATRMLLNRSQGVLNAATGTVISFRDAAEAVVGHFPEPATIKGSPRVGPMPHNGYRPFDPAATAAAFPDFAYTQPEDGFAKVHAQMAER